MALINENVAWALSRTGHSVAGRSVAGHSVARALSRCTMQEAVFFILFNSFEITLKKIIALHWFDLNPQSKIKNEFLCNIQYFQEFYLLKF
jgi:hypothetical protein